MRKLAGARGADRLKRRGFLGLMGASLVLAACDMPAMSVPGSGTARPAVVALMLPSGDGDAGRQVLARELENAARMALADLEGVPIDLRIYQVGVDPNRAAAQTAQAINDGAQIILGPLHAQAVQGARPVAAQAGINMISFSNNPDVAGGNVFLLGPMFENTATRLLGFSAAQGRGRVMVVSEQTDAGRVAERAIQRAAQRTAASVVATQSYPFSQQGITQAIPRIASAARSSGAQSILMTAGSEGALPLLAEMLPQNNVSPSDFKYMGLTRWDIPAATLQLPGLQGGWFALPDPGLTQQFESRYRAAYGSTPSPVAGLSYDAMAAVGTLMRRGGRTPFTAEAITQSAGFVGVNGIFRFRSDGTNERALAVAEIRDQRVRILSAAPRSFAGGGS
ncbi:MAG: penicillin-binding protein activator [Rhodobacteraceae bacterium]|nr:penicillin-binding protein activator [Paracoccaceae bacterium]MCC5965852.1 penicillin-binding protein activator [Natronohydrobacter sp.]